MTAPRLMTFDGGGVRGLLTAELVRYLEQQVGAPMARYIDLFAGTSVGAILACALASTISAERCRALIVGAAERIFPRGWAWFSNRAVRTFRQGVSAPLYDPAGLRDCLRDVFGERRFGSLARRAIVPVYDVQRQEAVLLDSTQIGHADLRVVDVCLASAAAPIYFPAMPLRIHGRTVAGIDGGVCSNNPALVAWTYAERRADMRDAMLLSFGTGSRTRPVGIAEALRYGAVQWVRRGNLVGTLLDGPSNVVDQCCRSLVPADRYFRFQTPLHLASDAMDDASPANLSALVAEAQAYIRERDGGLHLDLAADALLRSAAAGEPAEVHA